MTNNEVLDAVSGVEFGTVLAWILSIAALIGICITLCIKIYKAVEKYRKVRNNVEDEHKTFQDMKSTDEELLKEIKLLRKELHEVRKCSVVATRGELKELLDEYNCKGYIPSEEFDEFEETYEAYINAGGNGSMKRRYDIAIQNLEIR